MLTYKDRTQSLSDWITELQLNRALVLYRLRYGWPVHEAFTVPAGISLAAFFNANSPTHTCRVCGHTKARTEFYAHQKRCKKCAIAQKKSPPRPKWITNLEIAERDNWTCHICQGTVTRKDWSLDHIIPFTKGGKRVRENLLLAHKLCNQRRSNKTLERAS
jgi:5-methylcytosine-specific restriction endonuclease McrA